MTERQPSSRPAPGHVIDEATLVEQARQDPTAFAALYDRYIQPVYRYISSRQGDPQAAQELVAQVFLTARDTLGRHLPGDNFAVFLFSIARGQLAGYLRKGGPLAPAVEEPAAGQPRQQLDHLRGLIRGMSEGEQELLRLRYAAGLGFSDLSALVRAAPEAVKTELDRMLQRLLSQAAAGQFDYPRDVRRFENHVRAAVRGVEADLAFVARLREQFAISGAPGIPAQEEPARSNPVELAGPVSRLSALPGLTWLLLLLAMVLFLILAMVLVIGPQRLWREALALAGVVSQPVPPGERAPELPTTLVYPTPTILSNAEVIPTAEPGGIRFEVEQVSEQEDGYLLQGSLSWQGTAYFTLGFDPYLLELVDADGQPVPMEPVEPNTSARDPAEQRMPWAVRVVGKDHPGPLTLSLPVLEGFQEVSGVTFDLDLGVEPRPGQTWPVDLAIEASGRQVHVLRAGLSQAVDGAYWLEFTAQVDPQQVTGIFLHDPGNPPAQGGGQGGSDGQGLITESLRYDSLPQGLRRIEVNGIWTLAGGRWTVPVMFPGQ